MLSYHKDLFPFSQILLLCWPLHCPEPPHNGKVPIVTSINCEFWSVLKSDAVHYFKLKKVLLDKQSYANIQINVTQKCLNFICVSQKCSVKILNRIQTRFESQMLRIVNNVFSETKMLKGKRAQEMMRVYHKR